MRNRSGLAVLTVLLTSGLLASCTAQPPATTPRPASTAPSEQLTPAEVDVLGPRAELPGGLLLKQLGKVAEIRPVGAGPDEWHLRVAVDKIEIDPACDGTAPRTRRHRLLLSIRAETSQIYTEADGVPHAFEWSTVGPDGVSENPPSSSQACKFGSEIPSQFRPSARYRGFVTVDTDNPAGQLILADKFAWNYPTNP